MYDAIGASQFMSAVVEMAKGATSPSVLPVWERHLLNSRNPDDQHFINKDTSDDTNNLITPLEADDPCYKTFIFGPNEISALWICLPLHLRHCSSFEIITSAVWKCRVAVIQSNPAEEVSMFCAVNLRGKPNHFIPVGYYGNITGFSISTSTAKEIIDNPLCYTLQVLRNAKEKVFIEDYDRSIIGVMLNMTTYIVSTVRYARFEEFDFGWGNAIYAGIQNCMPCVGWYHAQFNRESGEDEIILPFCLPKQAMERFEMELNNMLKDQPFNIADEANVITFKL